jgi:hypothetical protein
MGCLDKERIVSEYEIATARFADAVHELKQNIGTSERSEYDRLLREANEHRIKSEEARLALERHLTQHGC